MLESYNQTVDLSEYTTFKISATAEYFALATSEEELKQLLKEANEAKQPVTIIGGGSNVLLADSGIKGCLIVLKITGIEVEKIGDEILLKVAAGENFDSVVEKTVNDGYWGLENLSAIPGSVGAAPIQNIGAYGVEVGELITTVRAINYQTAEEKIFSNTECQFGYRDSFFKTAAGREWIVLEVTFSLTEKNNAKLYYKDLTEYFLNNLSPTLKEIRTAIIFIRGNKFPDWKNVGTAGSFFKNPIITKEHYAELLDTYPDLVGHSVGAEMVKVSLGWILDKACNLRGYYRNNVGCFEKQALVLVTKEKVRAEEIINFADFVAEEVFKKTKIKIEWEVTLLN